MPLQLRANQTHLVVCGLSGKRYSGVAELYELLKPLLPEGVVLIPRDGLCSMEALNRYVRWARAAFFIRVEASDAVREANGWKSQFGPEDLVRDDHWTELALDEWDGWDAVIQNDGDSSTLCAEAHRLAACVAELRRKPELSRHIALPEGEVKRTEFTTVMPECMRLGGAEAYVPSQVTECPKLVVCEGIKVQPFTSHQSEVPSPFSGTVARTEPVPEHPEVDPVLPFLKGMALERLKCTEQAANHLEESIAMKPGFRQAHLEFQQAASELDDVERCRRVAQLLVDQGGYWVNCLQRPLHFASNPKVRSQPWYDPQLFELVHALEKNFHAIRGELEAFNKSRWSSVGSAHRGNENSRHDADLVSTGEWREVVLLGDSDECEENCRECPMTAELLRSFSEVSQCAEMRLGESLFSQLLPGTRLRSHCGPSNLRLTCHLGIRIPSGCKIVCGGEPCCWEEGKCIVFDDSFEHEVLHEGDEARTVLLVNFWHPDVPPEMRHGLMSAARSPHDLAA